MKKIKILKTIRQIIIEELSGKNNKQRIVDDAYKSVQGIKKITLNKIKKM